MSWGELAVAATTAAPAPARSRSNALYAMDAYIAAQESGSLSERGMDLPALFSVVRLISSTVDQLPIVASNGPAPDWVRRPRAYGSALDQGDLIQFVVSSMLLNGHAYLLARKLSGGSWRLDALHEGSVQAQVSASGVVRLDYRLDGEPISRVPAWQQDWRDGESYLVAIPYLVTPDHPEGTSPVRSASQSIDGFRKVEKQAATLLDGGTHSGGRLESDQDLSQSTAQRYQATWVENRKLGKIPVLGAGLRYVNDFVDPAQAQWLESRIANAQACASMFGVPPDLLGYTMAGGGSSLAYQNSQDNLRRFRMNCIQHITDQISDSVSLLLPPGRNAAEQTRIVFDFTEWEEAGDVGTDTDPEA